MTLPEIIYTPGGIWMIVKKKILILGGKVHDVGYRPFLLGVAEGLGVERFFADNTVVEGRQAVEVLIDDEEGKVKAFMDVIGRRRPENAVVEKIEQLDYEGRVMGVESYFRYLNAMQLSRIATYGGAMLGKQDMMLEKQDETIAVIREESGKTREVVRGESRVTREGITGALKEGFGGVKKEHVRTRELSKEIFYAEVRELRQGLRGRTCGGRWRR